MKKQFIYSYFMMLTTALVLLNCKGDPGATPNPNPGGGTTLAISSINPASGAEGTKVVISGTGFSTTLSNNIVKFGTVAAVVDSASATRIVTKVPKDAKTGKVSVEVGGQVAASTADFTMMANPPVFGAANTNSSADITAASAKVSSTITSKGDGEIIQHGHVWSDTKSDPTPADAKTELGKADGPFPLKFTSDLKSLKANTTYNVRAYATNDKGTSYGAAVQVMTGAAPLAGSYTVKAKFPGAARNSANYFAFKDKLYVIGGSSGTGYLKDLWEYDPAQDKWAQKADAPITQAFGSYRIFHFGASSPLMFIDNKIFVIATAEYLGNPKKTVVLEFDTNSNTWAVKGQAPETDQSGSNTFTINKKGYLLTGRKIGNNLTIPQKVYQYDPSTDNWLQKKDFPGKTISGGASAAYNGKGYVMGGLDKDYGFVQEMWEYDDGKDDWTILANYPQLGAVSQNNTFLVDNILTINSGETNYRYNFDTKSWNVSTLPDAISKSPAFGGGTCRIQYWVLAQGVKGSIYFFHLDSSGGTCNNLMGELWEYKP
ncbi:IPT/TIG domain-containing protein [Dyadobacter arcticus]|uniref:N-acetylneuraminic acid mutarotase n=1 Tax=Dyadobacter arcticus TaxID=1078754 RepID=A0ABX0UKP5_9BACT|nr:kelch repeat-containing protein [Dyadobacter arcticus]NIJ52649.1 N-acetylneuraminic acid mutarotase [Dyadobacter arcticus]